MPPLLLKLVFQRLPQGPVPALLRPLVRAIAPGAQSSYIDPQLATHIGFWESELMRQPWFAGEEFSAADIQMSFPVEVGRGARRRAARGAAARLSRAYPRPSRLPAGPRGGRPLCAAGRSEKVERAGP